MTSPTVEEHNLLDYSSSSSSSEDGQQYQQGTECVVSMDSCEKCPLDLKTDELETVIGQGDNAVLEPLACSKLKDKPLSLRSLLRLHWAPLLLMWLAHAATGAANALPGSCLLALASRVGATLSAMGLWFTVKSAAACLLAIVTGFALPWLKKSQHRLGFLIGANLLCAAALLAVPMARSLWTALGLSGALGAGQSALETADGILAIVLFGSQHSRPILQSLHLAVALGALAAPALLHPFRSWEPPAAEAPPPNSVATATASINATLDSLRVSLCHSEPHSSNGPASSTVATVSWSNSTTASAGDGGPSLAPIFHAPIFVPFAVVHAAQTLAAVGFLLLLILRHRLEPSTEAKAKPASCSSPMLEPVEVQLPSSAGKAALSIWRRRVLVGLTVAFYFCFVGVENVFWSYINAYGVCSRLRLTALNAAFFAGFLAGRCLGVALARCVRPAVMLLADLAACQMSLATLCILAGDSSLAVNAPSWLTSAATAAFGLSVASIYASGISWLEERLNVTGPLACSWTIGSQLGVSVLPALAGHLMLWPGVGPAGVLYLALGGFSAACLCFAGMLTTAHVRL